MVSNQALNEPAVNRQLFDDQVAMPGRAVCADKRVPGSQGEHNTLSVQITGSATRSLDLDVRFVVAPTQRVAIIGHNGSGKTSVLRLIAGLDYAQTGTVISSGDRIHTADGTHISVPDRQIPMGFAEPRLFTHMSVLKNLTFGPARGRGASSHDQARALDALKSLGISHLAHKPAGQLSSGQSAAVAVLRTIFAQSCAVLLDEPFSALDTAIASEVRAAVRTWLETLSVPLLIATHNPLDVMALATHVAVMEQGKLTQFGTVAEVAQQPRSQFTAQFLGLNLLRGTAAHVGPTAGAGDPLKTAPHTLRPVTTVTVGDRQELTLAAAQLGYRNDDYPRVDAENMGAQFLSERTSHDRASHDRAPNERAPHHRASHDRASRVVSHKFIAAEQQVFVAFSPASVTLSLAEPHGSAQNTWLAPATSVEQVGSIMRVSLGGPAPVKADITTTAALSMGVRVGQRLWVSVKATAIEVYPA